MSYLDFVNARMGTLNDSRYSNGNIYPVTACPFGMANFCIQTNGGNWFFHPLAHTFEGFRLTHQPSPWVGDYGHILLYPFTGEYEKDASRRFSSFRPEQARLDPPRIGVYLQRYRISAQLAPTERGACFTLESGGKDVSLALVPFAPSSFTFGNGCLTGYTDSQSIWGFERVREYFYAEFTAPVLRAESLDKGGIALYFAGKSVQVRLATSFISEEQAKRNFDRELHGAAFAEIERRARAAWEDCLGRISVSDEAPERKRTFYSCLYRAFLYPRKFYEYDEAGKPVHFNADTGRTERGVFYTDNGFWDTYRTEYPLLTLLMPDLVREMAEGFVNYGEETGWLPKWLSPGEIGLMPGTLVEAMLADACVKGIVTGELRKRAYALMKKNAFGESGDSRRGRRGIKDYIALGYVPNDYRESVNHTCDCAYGDYCIAQVALLEGDTETAELLLSRSKNYAALFDKESGFLRGKDRDGRFKEPFDPYEWGGDNCEGSSWQNSFAVYHDVGGLATLHGGAGKLEARLDELFGAPPVFEVGGYGQEIHEMSEMASADFGQCAISNQPSFHIPWLYAAIGRRDKTEFWVERLASEAFSAKIDGFPGDEDNGTMASWYVFACLGFYPLCPAKAEYVASKPLFSEMKIGDLTIGKIEKSYITHAALAAGIHRSGGKK